MSVGRYGGDDTHEQGYPGLIENDAERNHLKEDVDIVLRIWNSLCAREETISNSEVFTKYWEDDCYTYNMHTSRYIDVAQNRIGRALSDENRMNACRIT